MARVHGAAAYQAGLLVVGGWKDQRPLAFIDVRFQRQGLRQWADQLALFADAWQLTPSKFAVVRLAQRVEHRSAPLRGAQVHDAGGRRRRHAHAIELAGQVARRQGAVWQDAIGAVPVII